MKKLLLFCCAAGLVAMSSCNGSGKPELKNAADSLSYYIALGNASMIKQQIYASKDDSVKFNVSEFQKGFKQALSIDSANRSYTAGLQFGMQMKQMEEMAKAQFGADFSEKLMKAGVAAAFAQDTLDPQKVQPVIMMLVNKLQAEKAKSELANNEAEGKAFMESEMKKDDSYKKTESGIAYKVISEGEGENFADGDVVECVYTGSFTNGEVFDSSNGQPRKLPVNAVVPGFSETLKMMKPGAHYVVIIPGNLAYGEAGQPYGGIGPNKTLVFDIETVGVAQD